MDKHSPSSAARSRLTALVSEVEDVANDVTDSDREWWPFGFLKPAEHQPLSTARVSILALLYGLPTSVLMLIADKNARGSGTMARQLLFVASVCLGFLVIYRSTFAYFWNRRAERLEKLAARRRAWQRGQPLAPYDE